MSSFSDKWSHKISAARRAEWQRIMERPQPDGRVAYYRNRQMLWFVGSELVVDGLVFADCCNLPNDRPKIIAEIHRMLGKIHIVWNK